MELPIAPQSYQPSAEALARASKRARVIAARAMAQESAMGGGTAFVRAEAAGVRAANFFAEAHLPEGADADEVIDECLAHFSQRNLICHAIDPADANLDVALGAAAQRRGFVALHRQVLLLQAYRRPERQNQDLQVIPIRAAYAEARRLFRRQAEAEFSMDADHADAFAAAMTDRLDEPRVESFMARLDGRPAGVAGVITLGQIGVIDPAWTDPEVRGRGVAGTLMTLVLEHCMRAQFEQVLIDRGRGCTSIPFYESLGFRPAGEYVRLRWSGDE